MELKDLEADQGRFGKKKKSDVKGKKKKVFHPYILLSLLLFSFRLAGAINCHLQKILKVMKVTQKICVNTQA